MIFIGDIAIPYSNAIKFEGFPKNLLDKNWFGNLEGALVDNRNNEPSDVCGVFNDKESITQLTNDFHYIGFALANNHIFDAGSCENTISYLKELNIAYSGIGRNITDTVKPLKVKDGDVSVLIINLGWEVIQCRGAKKNKKGVASLTKENAFNILASERQKRPHAKIIFFMHWGYELEELPQPRERELAKALIDKGADGIIGSHSHCIGEFELYKGKPIIYSLGNWMFKQNYYFNGEHKFPDFCNNEIAFEWDFQNNIKKIHHFMYNKKKSTLSYIFSDIFDENFVSNHSLIHELTNNEYKTYYKNNHYHKSKGLPIYYWEDSKLTILLKNKINKLRDIALSFYIKIKQL